MDQYHSMRLRAHAKVVTSLPSGDKEP